MNTYVNEDGRPDVRGLTFTDPMAVLLPHFFNHQTHHRGQVSPIG